MSTAPRIPAALCCTLLASGLLSRPARAIQLDDPVNFRIDLIWSGASLGVPGLLGALRFSDDGLTAYLVGNSEQATSAVYEMAVIREPITERVIGFGPASLLFSGNPATRGIDAGLEIGPSGTLFYTYYPSHIVAERTATASTVEVQFPMAATGVPSSVAGLVFSPHLFDAGSGFAQMQVSSWAGDGVYNVPLVPQGGGVYAPGTAELFVRLPQQGTGAIQYVPQGRFTGNLMYVNWNYGEVRMVVIDKDSGYPIDNVTGLPTLGTITPRDIRFAYELGVGPWGLEFDPLSQDFFVTTWNGNPGNSVVQFTGQGFANQPPVAFSQTATTPNDAALPITLSGSDATKNPLSFAVVVGPSHGTLTGTTATVLYTPTAGYVGSDFFSFVANDGQLDSATATVSITVLAASVVDAGTLPDSGDSDGAVATDAGEPDAGSVADAGAGADVGSIADAASPDLGGGVPDTGTSAGDAGVGSPDLGLGTDVPEGEDEGCGCSTGRRSRPGSAASLGLLALIVLARRRNRAG